jgi:hypothetical protein
MSLPILLTKNVFAFVGAGRAHFFVTSRAEVAFALAEKSSLN